MEIFKIFATMSLVDAISKPLGVIQTSLKNTELAAGGLSARLGKMAAGWGKAALPAAAFLGVLGATTMEAARFESKMADVAKVVNFESPAELQEMSRALQDLSLQIPIAAEGFADITAAAAQSGVAKADLVDFGVQAAKMGVAFDVAAGEASKTMADWRAAMGLTLTETYRLADAVNHLANNLNATAPAISEVLNRVGAVGKAVGFTQEQLAALAAAGLSAGADASIVGTGLNSLFATLSSGSNMTKAQAEAFKRLGFEAQGLARSMQIDAQGTLIKVLESIGRLPAEKQIATLTAAFGELSLKTIAPMVGNLDNLRWAFNLVGEAANFAGSMEAEFTARSATTENALQLMKNSFNVLAITVGSLFLPVLNALAESLSFVVKALVAFARTETGGFLLKLAAGFAAAVVGVTGLVAALALLKPAFLLIGGALSPILGPLALVAGAVTLLAIAWKTDFMGIATSLTKFGGNVKLVFSAVMEWFSVMQDGRGRLSAELSEKIEAAGLTGLVTTVTRVVYRVYSFFKGFAAGIRSTVGAAFGRLGDMFGIVGAKLKPLGGYLKQVAAGLGLAAGETDTACWSSWGEVLGTIAGGVLGFLVDVLGVAVSLLGGLADGCAWCVETGRKLGDGLFDLVAGFGNFIQAAANLGVALRDTLLAGLNSAWEAIKNFDLLEAGRGLINGFIDGIKAGAGALVSAVSGILSQVRDLLPFSDAAAGPLSNLTASGMAFISTFAEGIRARAGALIETISGVLGKVRQFLPFSDAQTGPLANLTASGRAFSATYAAGITAGAPALTAAAENMEARLFGGINLAPPYFEMPGVAMNADSNYFNDLNKNLNLGEAGGRLPRPSFSRQEVAPGQTPLGKSGQFGNKTVTLHIGRIELPAVTDAQGFVAALEAIASERV